MISRTRAKHHWTSSDRQMSDVVIEQAVLLLAQFMKMVHNYDVLRVQITLISRQIEYVPDINAIGVFFLCIIMNIVDTFYTCSWPPNRRRELRIRVDVIIILLLHHFRPRRWSLRCLTSSPSLTSRCGVGGITSAAMSYVSAVSLTVETRSPGGARSAPRQQLLC